jgi:hypothetical protein
MIVCMRVAQMVHRVNIILDDAAWLALQDIPKGERSKLVSKAIKQMSEIQRRQKAAQMMDQLGKKMPQVTTKQLVSWIRNDRQR